MVKQRSLATYIILSIITCGIYSIYFWYQYAEDVNKTCYGDGEETTNYIIAILLSIVTCGIYMWFWFYKLGNRLQANAPRYNMSFQENGTTVLLWMLLGSFIVVGPLIGMYYLIKNLNAIGNAYNAHISQANQAN